MVKIEIIMEKENEKHVCCLCGKEFVGWGNNAWPLNNDGICCDECNTSKVIPARLALIK